MAQKGVLADFGNFTGKHLCWSLHGDLHRVADITSYGKVSFNYHVLFPYARHGTHDLILQSAEIVPPAIVPITVLGNDKNHYYVML